VTALSRQEDRACWSFLRDLDLTHRDWMLTALGQLIYSFNQTVSEEAWSWLAINECDACASLLKTKLPCVPARWSMLSTLDNASQIPWASELILIEEDDKRRGVLSDWLITQEFAILDNDKKWLANDEAKRVYVTKTSLKQLVEHLDVMDFRALELWLQQSGKVSGDDLLAWHKLDSSSWMFILYNSRGVIDWSAGFEHIPQTSVFEFLRGLEFPQALIPYIKGATSALVTHGDWLVQFSECAPIFARGIADKDIGDYCFEQWTKHAPLAADIAFSSLWTRFSGSFDDDYLSLYLIQVVDHLSDDALAKLVVPGRDERSEACFKLLMEQAKRNSAAVQLLHRWWHASEKPVDILYAAANSGLCKSDLIGKWAITKLGEAIDKQDNVAWNLVDVLIENRAERSSLLKLGSSLLSSKQLKSPPGIKFIAYASGKINNVSDL